MSILVILMVLASGYWQVLYAVTFVSSVVTQFSQPSSLKIVKRNVQEEYVPSAVAITQSSQSLFLILGPIVGTFIYTSLGIQVSLYSILCLFILSAVLLSFLPKNSLKKQNDTTWLSGVKEGWDYAFRSRSLRRLALVFGLVGLSSGLVNPLEIFIITERLGLEQTSLQFLSRASGLLVGGGIAAAVSSKLNRTVTLTAGLFCLALATLGEVLSGWFWLTLSISILGSISLAFVNVVISTFLVTQIDEHLIGRVNGTITPLFMGAMLMGSFLSGVLMQNTSLLIVYAFLTLVLMAPVLPILRIQFVSRQSPAGTQNKERIRDKAGSN